MLERPPGSGPGAAEGGDGEGAPRESEAAKSEAGWPGAVWRRDFPRAVGAGERRGTPSACRFVLLSFTSVEIYTSYRFH